MIHSVHGNLVDRHTTCSSLQVEQPRLPAVHHAAVCHAEGTQPVPPSPVVTRKPRRTFIASLTAAPTSATRDDRLLGPQGMVASYTAGTGER
jgi:hypothetical protein